MTLTTKTTEIWKSFAGMYGADALLKKFGATPPPEWLSMIARLQDFEIDRAMRRLAYGAKSYVPSLPEFVKLARTIANDDWDEPAPSGLAMIAQEDGRDAWDLRANLWLLNYITNRARADVYYCCAKTLDFATDLRIPGAKASQESGELTQPLVNYKNAWARDMREAAAELGAAPDIKYQTKHWRADMALAETEVNAVRERLGI